jgi:hypothetical protein
MITAEGKTSRMDVIEKSAQQTLWEEIWQF